MTPPPLSPPLSPSDDIALLIQAIKADRIGNSALIIPLSSELPAELALELPLAPEDELTSFHSFSHKAKSPCEESGVSCKASGVLVNVAGRYEIALVAMAIP